MGGGDGGACVSKRKKQPNLKKSRIFFIADISLAYATRLPSVRQKDNASFPLPAHKECCLQTAITDTRGREGK